VAIGQQTAAPVDVTFVAQVHTALAGLVRTIADEARGDGWAGLQHRQLAVRVKGLVAAWRCGLPCGQPLDLAARLTARLRELQGPSGLFTGGDNVDSPPDSAFSVNDLADALLMLRRADEPAEVPLLEELLSSVTPALLAGGVHTPNHRWELSAALARLHRLAPRDALAERVDRWLAEGVDIDEAGLYSERSAVYAAFVSNPSLLVLAEVMDRPDLLDAVERNLDATLDLLLPDGSVETVLSRRQDQRTRISLAPYLLPLRKLARLRCRGDFAWAAGLALAQGLTLPEEAAAQLVLEPEVAHALPAPVEPRRPRRRFFRSAGLLVDHRPAATTVVFGGSDYQRHQRIRSGLANSPTLLRLFAGAAVLDSVRLSRAFFSHGPFRGRLLDVEPDTVTLTETVSAAYYQPLDPADHDPGGAYALVDEGRFSAAMDFGRRAQDRLTLTTSVRVHFGDDGVEVAFDVTGAVVDWALELAFRPGGTMAGARSLGTHTWQLDATAGAAAVYQLGNDAITITALEASDGAGGAIPAAHAAPAYEPGEDYRFLGGTDAATGERLYVTARVPAALRLKINAAIGSL
jgi:hypothetical protein